MGENKTPDFASLEELVEFFDTNDMSEYFDEMPDVHFDVNIRHRTFLVSVDKQLMERLTKVARSRNTSTEELVNRWLEEKVAQAA